MTHLRLVHALQTARRVVGGPSAEADRDLLRRFAEGGDGRAFEALVRRHGPLVLAVCRRVLGHEQDAEDAFQGTFLTLARRAATVRDPAALPSWLHGAAYRTAMAVRRAATRRRAHEAEAETRPPADPGWQAAWREVQAVLDAEVRRLPARLRSPFVLCCLEGHGRGEAARLLGLPEGTVWSRLARARALLRGRLARRGIALNAVLSATALSSEAGRAAVPEALVAVVTRAATSGHTGAATGLAGVARGLTAVPLRTRLALVLAVGLLAGGAAALAHRTGTEPATPEAAADPAPEAAAARTDRYGDPLPPGVLARMGTAHLRHGDGLDAVAFLPDGRELLTAGGDGLIRFWDPSAGRELRHIRSRQAGLALSRDGKWLAAAGGKNVVILDARTGQEVRTLRGDAEYHHPAPVVFAADGATVAAAAQDGSVRIYRVATGEERLRLPPQDGGVACLALTPDGQSVVTAGGTVKSPVLRVWELPGGRMSREVALKAEDSIRVMPRALSHDGRTLAAEVASTARERKGNGTVVFTVYRLGLWDVREGRERLRLGDDREPLWTAAFSRDDTAVAVNGMGNRISVWETATGRPRARLEGYPNGCRPDGLELLAFSPDGSRLAAVGESAAVHVWDLASGKEVGPAGETHHADVATVAYSPDGRTLATGGGDHTVRLWEAATGRQLHLLRGHAAGVRGLAFSPDGATLASADREGGIRLWEAATGRPLRAIQAVPKSAGLYTGICPIAFTPDGRRLLSWGDDRQMCLWDVATGQELWRRRTRLTDAAVPAGRPEGFEERGKGVDGVCFSADGRVAAVAVGESVYVLDTMTGRELVKLPGPSSPLCLALSADGRALAVTGWDGWARLWEVASGQELMHAENVGHVNAVAIAPDGRSVAAGSEFTDGVIHLLDTRTGQPLAQLRGHGSYVGALAYAPDGQSLASGQRDTTALIWDVRPSLGRLGPLPAGDLESLWAALAGADARKARDAVRALAATPGAVPFLKERLRPAERVAPDRLRRLIAELDSPRFASRESAAKELAAVWPEAEPALREALKGGLTLEARRRTEALLANPPPIGVVAGDTLRRMRAVEVLEAVGSPEAVAVLTALAGGAPAARETAEARAASERLARGR
jgi:RNA polymerase sigma factor (sigma-70 family)